MNENVDNTCIVLGGVSVMPTEDKSAALAWLADPQGVVARARAPFDQKLNNRTAMARWRRMKWKKNSDARSKYLLTHAVARRNTFAVDAPYAAKYSEANLRAISVADCVFLFCNVTVSIRRLARDVVAQKTRRIPRLPLLTRSPLV